MSGVVLSVWVGQALPSPTRDSRCGCPHIPRTGQLRKDTQALENLVEPDASGRPVAPATGQRTFAGTTSAHTGPGSAEAGDAGPVTSSVSPDGWEVARAHDRGEDGLDREGRG